MVRHNKFHSNVESVFTTDITLWTIINQLLLILKWQRIHEVIPFEKNVKKVKSSVILEPLTFPFCDQRFLDFFLGFSSLDMTK